MGMLYMQAIILAGGQSTRMGRDKALLPVNSLPLIQHLLQIFLAAEVYTAVVANDDKLSSLPQRCSPLLISIKDAASSFQGPLSGLLAGMQALTSEQRLEKSVCLQSCDAFGLNIEVFNALESMRSKCGVDIACLNIHGRVQPLIAVISMALLPSLKAYFDEGGRSVMTWYNQQTLVYLTELDLAAMGLVEGSYATNLNTPADIVLLSESLAQFDIQDR